MIDLDENLMSMRQIAIKHNTNDHIIPISKGGNSILVNYQILSWFENRSKNNLSQDIWNSMKHKIKEYFI